MGFFSLGSDKSEKQQLDILNVANLFKTIAKYYKIDFSNENRLYGEGISQLFEIYNLAIEERFKQGNHSLIKLQYDDEYGEMLKLWTLGAGATVPLIARYVAEQQLIRIYGKGDYSSYLKRRVNEIFPGSM